MTHKILDLESDLPQLRVDAHQVISYLLIFTISKRVVEPRPDRNLTFELFSFTKYKIAIGLSWNLENWFSKNSTAHTIKIIPFLKNL